MSLISAFSVQFENILNNINDEILQKFLIFLHEKQFQMFCFFLHRTLLMTFIAYKLRHKPYDQLLDNEMGYEEQSIKSIV